MTESVEGRRGGGSCIFLFQAGTGSPRSEDCCLMLRLIGTTYTNVQTERFFSPMECIELESARGRGGGGYPLLHSRGEAIERTQLKYFLFLFSSFSSFYFTKHQTKTRYVHHTRRNRTPLKRVGRSCTYFTVIRHPVHRLVSAFFDCPIDHGVQRRPLKVRGGRGGGGRRRVLSPPHETCTVTLVLLATVVPV